VLETHVLPRLNPVDLAMFSRTSSACRAAVVNAGLPRAGLVEGAGVWRGAGGGVEGFAGMWRGASSAAGCGGPLRVEDFVGSVVRLAWAFENGSPWNKKTSERVAAGGCLEALQWCVEQECPGAWEEWWRRAIPNTQRDAHRQLNGRFITYILAGRLIAAGYATGGVSTTPRSTTRSSS
jgi:hypothetical protein